MNLEIIISRVKHLGGRHNQLAHGVRHGSFGVVMNKLANWQFGSSDPDSVETKKGISRLSPTIGAARPFLFDLVEGKENERTEGIP